MARRPPQHRFLKRTYSLEEFGLHKSHLEPLYDEYLTAFEVETE